MIGYKKEYNITGLGEVDIGKCQNQLYRMLLSLGSFNFNSQPPFITSKECYYTVLKTKEEIVHQVKIIFVQYNALGNWYQGPGIDISESNYKQEILRTSFNELFLWDSSLFFNAYLNLNYFSINNLNWEVHYSSDSYVFLSSSYGFYLNCSKSLLKFYWTKPTLISYKFNGHLIRPFKSCNYIYYSNQPLKI